MQTQEDFRKACEEMQNMMDSLINNLMKKDEKITMDAFNKKIGEKAHV